MKFPDFDASEATCKPCSSSITNDKNTLPNEFYYVLTFGDLFDNANTPALVPEVAHYHVFNVSEYGRPVARVASAEKRPVPTANNGCCVPNKYTVRVRGTFPSGYNGRSRYCIVAQSTGGKMTPCLTYTGRLVDVKYGKTKKYTGSVTLSFSPADAAALTGDSTKAAKARDVFSKAFAKTLTLDPADVMITAIHTRAAGATAWTTITFNSDGTTTTSRRLASHTTTNTEVKADYQVITTKSGFTLTKESFDGASAATTLKAEVKKAAADVGVTVTVAAVTAEAPTGGSVGTVKPTTGGASAAFFPLVATILAAGAHLMF